MSQVCPTGFFCIDNTTLLIIVCIIFTLTAYLFSAKKIDLKLLEDYSDLIKAKEILLNEKKILIEKKIVENNDISDTKQIITTRQPDEPVIINQIIVNDNYNKLAQMSIVNKDYERLVNPLLPPERSYENTYGLPINLPTRGANTNYQQIGTLTSLCGTKIIPLFGKPMWRGSSKWNFYTFSDQFHAIKLPVKYKTRDCMDDTIGCDELYTDDIVHVPQYPDTEFRVNMYKLDRPTYIPFL
jgi:hypothetical protein